MKRSRLRPLSDKRRAWLDQFEAAKALVIVRSSGFCEVGDCFRHGTHVHHKKGQRVADANELSNLLHVCTPCHLDIHANPERSYRLGYLKSRVTADA